MRGRRSATRALIVLVTVVTAHTAATAGARQADEGSSRVAFAAQEDGVRTGAIWTVGGDGSGLRQLTTGGIDAFPLWSPDGDRIAFTGFTAGSQSDAFLVTMAADGTSRRDLGQIGSDGVVSWAPGGSELVATTVDGSDLVVVAEDGSGRRQLDLGFERVSGPAWSPDGSLIAFVAYGGDPSGAVWVVAPDGSGLTQLTAGVPPDSAGDVASEVAWAPDGIRIAYAVSSTGCAGSIRVVMVDGSDDRLVADSPCIDVDPAFSPDGDLIVYSFGGSSESGVAVVPADGSAMPEVLVSGGDASWPAWSPDGSEVAVSVHDAGATAAQASLERGLHAVAVDGSSARLLAGPIGADPSSGFPGSVGRHADWAGAPGGGGTPPEELPPTGPAPTTDFPPGSTTWLGAGDALGTAVAWSRLAYPDGAATALLGRDDHAPDLLASAVAQAAVNAPLLLTPPQGLADVTRAELERLGVTHVIILGGAAAVSEEVEAQLREDGYTVERVAGPTRIETAVAIARRFADASSALIVRSHAGTGRQADPTQEFADAIAAGGVAAYLGWPVLLTPTGSLAPATADHLVQGGINHVVVVGGTAAVSEAVVAQLQAHGVTVERVAGSNRFATAVALAAFRGAGSAADAAVAFLVEGQTPVAFASGLSAAGVAGANGPVVLAANGRLPDETSAWLDAADGQVALVCGPLSGRQVCDEGAVAAGTAAPGCGTGAGGDDPDGGPLPIPLPLPTEDPEPEPEPAEPTPAEPCRSDAAAR